VPKLYGAAGSAAGAADIAWLCTQAAVQAGCFAEQALRLPDTAVETASVDTTSSADSDTAPGRTYRTCRPL
jgi:hypothetical protein